MTTKEILSKSSILVGQEFSDRKEATIAAGKLLFQNGFEIGIQFNESERLIRIGE